MSYEKYKTIQTPEEFWAAWDEESKNKVDESLKTFIYSKYFLKCCVFQRDDFKCQNHGCGSIHRLTMHHIKFQKNKGQNKLKNCITICKTCHDAFHRAKKPLIFWGMTYQVHKDDSVDWKVLKKEAKKMRRSVKEHHGVRISWDMLMVLLGWLEKEHIIEQEEKDVEEDESDGE